MYLLVRSSWSPWQREMSSAAPSSRAAIRHGRATGNRAPYKGRKTEPSRGTAALKAKEEEYMRVNAELEAKTSALVQEAEDLVKGNLSLLSDLSSSPEQENGAAASAVRPAPSPPGGLKTGAARAQKRPRETEQSRPGTSSSYPHTGHQTNAALPTRPKSTQPVASRAVGRSSGHSSRDKGRVGGELQSHSRNEGSKTKTSSHIHSGETLKQPSKPLTSDIDETVRRLEKQLELEQTSSAYVSRTVGVSADVLPEAAEDMGSEALIRFLKAKLRVLQEELDEVCREGTEKDKKLSANHAQIKNLAEENGRLQRSHQTLQSQMSKYRDSTDTLKHKCEGLEAQLVAMRKEIENMKATQKKASSSQGALEVRLNRALEEAEKYKTELVKARAESKDFSKQERQRADKLVTENRQLERQRNELMVAFKKQMKLIDILKRQKMHIEAAKLLSFTEEEFVKALDWGTA